MTVKTAFFACIFGLLFASQLSGVSKDIPGESWLTFMGNSHRTGSVTGAAGPDVGEQIWTFRDGILGSPFAASPAISGNRVYIGSDDCKLYCLDAYTGSLIWEFEVVYEVFASPASLLDVYTWERGCTTQIKQSCTALMLPRAACCGLFRLAVTSNSVPLS